MFTCIQLIVEDRSLQPDTVGSQKKYEGETRVEIFEWCKDCLLHPLHPLQQRVTR